MRSIRMMGARFNEQDERVEIIKAITDDDGNVELNLHSIPVNALKRMAGELGTDDMTVVMDALVYEPFVNPVEPKDIVTKTQEFKAKYADRERKGNAERRTELARFGLEQKYLDAADNDPYEFLLQHSRFDWIEGEPQMPLRGTRSPAVPGNRQGNREKRPTAASHVSGKLAPIFLVKGKRQPHQDH